MSSPAVLGALSRPRGYARWEAWEMEVTREEARREIVRHDVEGGFEAFLREVGDRPTYLGEEVLGWLGY